MYAYIYGCAHLAPTRIRGIENKNNFTTHIKCPNYIDTFFWLVVRYGYSDSNPFILFCVKVSHEARGVGLTQMSHLVCHVSMKP